MGFKDAGCSQRKVFVFNNLQTMTYTLKYGWGIEHENGYFIATCPILNECQVSSKGMDDLLALIELAEKGR